MNIRVLLADDHATIRRGLAKLLDSEADMEVVGQASNGAEAIELAKQMQPQVILMDVSMPVMDGIEATRIITTEIPNVRVIGLSMFETVEIGRIMFNAGAICYLCKSAPASQIIAAIRNAAYKQER
jgi:DNA-binding NarL/FixJ family response regulator